MILLGVSFSSLLRLGGRRGRRGIDQIRDGKFRWRGIAGWVVEGFDGWGRWVRRGCFGRVRGEGDGG